MSFPRRSVRARSRTALGFALIVATLLSVPPAFALDTSVASLNVTGARSVASIYPSLDGSGVVIAVLDTGVDDEHPAFAGAFLAGVDASTNLLIEKDPITGASFNPDDRDGHGTHVAATALGRPDAEGKNRGVAPGAKLVDVKIASDVAGLSLGGVARGLKWVIDYNAGASKYGDPGANRVSIVSISFSTFSPGDPNSTSDSALARIEALVESGVIVVVAAGNCGAGEPSSSCTQSGANTIGSPGVARGAITVGAVSDQGTSDRADDGIAAYSSYGPNGAEPKPNVVAPGTRISSARCGGCAGNTGAATGYVEKSGTSMAAPHVSGVAALLLQAKPTLTPGEVKALLMVTAEKRWGGTDISANWGANYADYSPARGAGYVDALAAMRKLKGDNVPPVARARVDPALVGTPSTWFNFTAAGSEDPDGELAPASYIWSSEPGNRFFVGLEWRNVRFPRGNHTVTLVVKDAEGAKSAPVNLSITITPDPAPSDTDAPRENWAPHAVAIASSMNPRVGEIVSFDASLSTDPEEDALSFTWDLDGDAIPDATGEFVTHSFDLTGHHVVTLVVKDARGASDETTLTLNVRAPAGPNEPPPPSNASSDQTPPVIVILEPADGKTVLFGNAIVRWHARDDRAVVRVTAFVDDEEQAVSYTNETRVHLEPGVRVIRVVAFDAAANTGSSSVIVTVVDDDEATASPAAQVEPASDDADLIPAPAPISLIAGAFVLAYVTRRRRA